MKNYNCKSFSYYPKFVSEMKERTKRNSSRIDKIFFFCYHIYFAYQPQNITRYPSHSKRHSCDLSWISSCTLYIVGTHGNNFRCIVPPGGKLYKTTSSAQLSLSLSLTYNKQVNDLK